MEPTCSKAISRGLEGATIDKLPDDLLVQILSRLSLKEAARTSVLANRWRYLWRSVTGTLQFEFRDFLTDAGDLAEVEKFVSCVNNVLEVHQAGSIEGMTVLFEGMHEEQYDLIDRMAPSIDSWFSFAVRKQVERFDMKLSRNHGHKFPGIEMLKSHSHVPFSRLRTLRLVEVQVRDEVFSYLLASCPYLEYLGVCFSRATKNIRVVDPPRLRALELWQCNEIDSVEISAESLVSLSYAGREHELVLKKVPNLSELTIGNRSFVYFVRVVRERFSPFDQLVKLVVDISYPASMDQLVGLPDLPRFASLKRLEVRVYSWLGRSLLYFTSLIEASPQLCEFRIEVSYRVFLYQSRNDGTLYPAISRAEAVKFDHKSLKSVEMAGYVGCSSENGLLRELFENASSIERVYIDTRSAYYDNPTVAQMAQMLGDDVPGLGRVPEMSATSGYYVPSMPELVDYELGLPQEIGATTRAQSKVRAKRFASTAHRHIEFIIS